MKIQTYSKVKIWLQLPPLKKIHIKMACAQWSLYQEKIEKAVADAKAAIILLFLAGTKLNWTDNKKEVDDHFLCSVAYNMT